MGEMGWTGVWLERFVLVSARRELEGAACAFVRVVLLPCSYTASQTFEKEEMLTDVLP